MQAIWTANGGKAVNLNDGTRQQPLEVEDWGGEALEQVDALAFSAYVNRKLNGNVAGELPFTITFYCPSYAAMVLTMVTEYGRLGQQGTLTLVLPTNAQLVFANATMKSVRRAEWNGIRIKIRYRLGITTVSTPLNS